MNPDILLSIAVQFPLLVLFIVYNERKDKQFQGFLKEQRDAYVTALDKLTDKIESHDEKLEKHDLKTDRAIERMEERTRPRVPA